MSSAALFLDKVYEQQTELANKLNVLEAESKVLQDSFIQLVHRFWKNHAEMKQLAKGADDHCAEIYNHMEGAVEEVV
jgi:hypothetical protein